MEYATLEQVKIRLKQFHIDTVANDDETTSDVVVFDNKEDQFFYFFIEFFLSLV